MVIANLVYDLVLKKLMENDNLAKFFMDKILEQNIEDLKVKPEAFGYLKKDEKEFANPFDR